jgi:RimJ/RimL family protein N-acetyltransferase
MLIPSLIVTDRLTLTPLVEQDAVAMFDVLADERMHEFTGGTSLGRDELRRRYERLAVGHSPDGSELWFNWIVRMIVTGQPVGALQATVTRDGSTAEVAWEIGVPWQGDRIASEAAEAVVDWLVRNDVAVIRALIHPDHIASMRVAARAGLEQTAEQIDGETVWLRLVG